MATRHHGSIEVGKCAENTTVETLSLYFENTRRSGGGDITRPVERRGGNYIITFDDPSVVESVISGTHTLEGNTLSVRKYVDAVDSTKLLVKNISSSTTVDGLSLFLENVTGSEVENLHKDDERRQAVAMFVKKIDVERVIRNYTSKPAKKRVLDGKTVRLCPLDVTRSVTVDDLPNDITQDWLELYFENKRSGGGPIQDVVIDSDLNSAKITFVDPAHVNSVLNRSHSFRGISLSVSACYGLEEDGVEEEEEEDQDEEEEERDRYSPFKSTRSPEHQYRHREPAAAPHSFQKKGRSKPEYTVPIEADILHFIEGDRASSDEFRQVMEQVDASVIRDIGGNTIRVVYSKDFLKYAEKEKWEAKSRETLVGYLEQYCRKTVTVMKEIWTSVVKDLEDMPQASLKVSKDFSQGTIVLTGRVDSVEKATAQVDEATKTYLAKLEREARRKTSKIQHQSKGKLAVLQQGLDRIKQRNPSVDIQINWKMSEVEFTGCDEDISQAMCCVYEDLNTFVNRRFPVKACLASFLEGKVGRQKMRELLKKQGLRVGVDLEQSDVSISGKSDSDVKSARSTIESNFKVEEIRNKSDITPILEKEDFLSMVAMLQETYHVEINFDHKTVVVTGLNKDVNTAKKKISDYILANIKTTKFLPFDESIMRYIKNHKMEEDGAMANTRAKLFSINGKLYLKHNGFHLEGNPDVMSEAEREINKLVSTVEKKKRQIRFQNRGQCKFFIGGRGEDLAKGIERKVPCAIEVNKKGSFAEHKDRHLLATAAKAKSLSYPDSFVRHGKRISVKQGDLTAERVDVIVNSISGDIEKPFAGGISKALLKRAGDSLLRNTQTLSSLQIGDVKSTDSGNLKCQKVYHCVVDKWNGGKGSDILQTVTKCSLNMASKAGFTSIAFPSIGTGYLGFPHHKAAKIMFQEVLNFARKNPQSTLKDIRFVVFDSESVDAFKRESGNIQSMDSVSPPQYQSAASTSMVTHAKIDSVSLEIKQGDLTTEKVDAIINPVVANFEQGQVGRAIIKAGGNDIEQEYEREKFDLNNGPIRTGAGNLRNTNHVIHMVCPDSRSLAVAVEQCFNLADAFGFNSVAVPAIGTGHFGLSVKDSASGIIDAVKRFAKSKPGSLSTVKVVLFQSDMISEFGRTLGEATNRRGPPTSGASSQVNAQSKYERIGNVTVDIKQGDLTRQNVQCIVNPVTDSRDHGQVGNAIIKAGGIGIDSEYQSERHKLARGPIITGAGNLTNITGVIHLVCPDARSLAGEVESCLKLADRRRMASIAFPAIGTGYFGLTAEESARGIIEGVKLFSRCNPQSLKYVMVVLYQANMVSDFARVLGGYTSRKPAQTTVPSSGQSQGRPEVVITIYGDNDNDLGRAEREIRKIVSEEVIDTVIEDDLIAKLDKNDVSRLKVMGSRTHVDVKVADKSQGALKDVLSHTPFVDAKKVLQIHGLKSDVGTVKTMIHSWLENFEKAIEKQKTVKWYYIDWKGKNRFDTMWNYEIETAKQNGQRDLSLLDEDGKHVFSVNLRNMDETNLRTKKVYKIERDGPDDTAITYPRSWESFPAKHNPRDAHLVCLKKGSQEYDRVSNDFLGSSGAFSPTVMKIERIQNKSQFNYYFMRKKEMDLKHPGGKNERFLYHGTKSDSVRLICKNGFNRSYAGSAVGAREGLGVYFAVNSGYSLKPYYSPADTNGDRFMFRVRVLVGKYAKGSSDMKEPPFLDQAKGDRYDTTTDDLNNPNMFVTFHDEQAYPEYLITFR